jgi:hypothetical protein
VPTGRGKTSGHAHSKPDAAVKQIPEALFSAYTKELPFPAASQYVTDLQVP